MLTDYYFWFAQPSTVLTDYDWYGGYFFGGLVALSILVWLANKLFVRHEVTKKLLSRYANAIFWFGILGAIWFAFRYQSIPIFSKRIVAGGVILIGIVWLGFITWYFIRKFFKEKREYDYNQVKNKYIK